MLRPVHRGSLATFSRFLPSCSAIAWQLAGELRDHVPYLNSPRQHLLRKEFVRRVGEGAADLAGAAEYEDGDDP